MKGTIFTLFFILFITTSAVSQLRPLHANDVSKLEAKFNVTVSDTANNSFFIQHSDIKQVWIIYRNRRPIRITPLLERLDRKSTRLNSSHMPKSRMPSSA